MQKNPVKHGSHLPFWTEKTQKFTKRIHVKIVKRFISVTIWSIIIINMLLLGISYLPAAQRLIGARVANAIGQKLDTQVSVGRVDLGFLNRMIIDDVVILDQQDKELLRISRLSAKIELTPLMKGRVSISSAQLFGAHVRLYRQNAQEKMNAQFVLDSLASKDTTRHTPLDLRINSFIIRRSTFSYDDYSVAPAHRQFDPSHLHVNNLSAYIKLRTLTDDSVSVNVRRMGFSERSGLEVNRLSFRLDAGKKQAILQDLVLQMPSSHIEADTLKATYLIDRQRLKPGSLTYSGGISETYVTPSDLRCFIPSLKNFQRPIHMATVFRGTDTQVTIPTLRLFSEEKDIDVDASGWLENWKSPAWHLQMHHIVLADNSIDFLTKTIRQLPPELKRIGNLQLTGTCNRNQQGTISLQSIIHSEAGNIDIHATAKADRSFKGNISAAGLNLQQLLAKSEFGSITTKITVEGTWHDGQKPDLMVDGTVSQFDYNGYSYSNITLDGTYRQGTLAGTFNIADPNINAQLKGELTEGIFDGPHDKAQKIQLQGTIAQLRPAALRLTDQWGMTAISAAINADFTAHHLNDAQGSLQISNFSMLGTSEEAPYRLNSLILSSGYEAGTHFVTLKSDFADAELRGIFDYKTLSQSFFNIIGSRLPTLPGLPAIRQSTDNNFYLTLQVSKSDWMKHLLGIDLELSRPITLNARINDRIQSLFLDGSLPSFVYNGAQYSDGSIHISTPADTLKCDISVNKFMDNGHHLDIDVEANAIQNRLYTSLNWDNHQKEEQMSGQLNSIIELYHNIQNKSEAHVRVQPSHMILNNNAWTVEPSDILYYENHLLVDHFSIHRGRQHIIVDGIASKYSTDTLLVDLNEVEVDYILDLVNFHSVEFSGKATGRASASSLFGEFAATADLKIDNFQFEHGRMGVLHARADWNQEKEQIDIHATAHDSADVKTHIDGHVSPVHNNIDLAIRADGTYIDFMHNFTKSFLSQITGHADGELRLAGPLDHINLTGKLIVDGEATVTPLNTTYTLRRDTVVMVPDEIELRRMPITDRNGNTGYLSGGIHHQHLTNLTYDLYVEAENLLAYDFTDFGESTFYGTVYATGDVAIHGRPNEVTINCNVTPQRNSVFVYNAANPDAISKQEFIEWDTAPSTASDGHVLSGNGRRTMPPARATDTDIYINFLINTTPEATLRLLMDASTKDYITLNGEGAVRATFHNKGAFNMFGTYTVDHGTYGITIQNIIKKNFTFNPGGTIVFGGDPYQAALNLQAVYTVNGVSLSDLNIGNSFTNNTIRVNCLMNIGGQPAAPQIDFDLEMPNVNADEQQMVRSVINGQQEMNQQVVYLLGIGRFYNQGTNNSGEQQADQTSLAMQSFLSGTLSTQINTLLNQVIKNDNWNFGANISTGNEGWHNAEYEGIINGRMFNNRLLLNGQFGYRDNATQANPSFIGDFDIQYLLYPNGNLALKVYNQTNDRYFTKSSLNTQGIGLIMKKDFNGLRDLFTSSRRRGTTSRARQGQGRKPSTSDSAHGKTKPQTGN